jgi:hypothetical protein
MTKEQLAEKLFPCNKYTAIYFRFLQKEKRAAFLKGLDLLPEFAEFCLSVYYELRMADDEFKFPGCEALLTQFLTEKYGSNEQTPME